MDYDSSGLVEELRINKQLVALAAVTSTLLLLKVANDRNNRSRETSPEVVRKSQDKAPKNERKWTAWVARQDDMYGGLSIMDRV